jgi:hypothetical protein
MYLTTFSFILYHHTIQIWFLLCNTFHYKQWYNLSTQNRVHMFSKIKYLQFIYLQPKQCCHLPTCCVFLIYIMYVFNRQFVIFLCHIFIEKKHLQILFFVLFHYGGLHCPVPISSQWILQCFVLNQSSCFNDFLYQIIFNKINRVLSWICACSIVTSWDVLFLSSWPFWNVRLVGGSYISERGLSLSFETRSCQMRRLKG